MEKKNKNELYVRAAAAMVELKETVGTALASMIYYAYIVPILLEEQEELDEQ